MSYLLEFANPKFCADNGRPLTWHPHRVYETCDEAEASAATFERPGLGILVRIYKLHEVKRERSPRVADSREQARAA